MRITEAKVKNLGESRIREALNPDSPKLHLLSGLAPALANLTEDGLSGNAATTLFQKWIIIQTELLKLDRGGSPSWTRITRAVREALRAIIADAKTGGDLE